MARQTKQAKRRKKNRKIAPAATRYTEVAVLDRYSLTTAEMLELWMRYTGACVAAREWVAKQPLSGLNNGTSWEALYEVAPHWFYWVVDHVPELHLNPGRDRKVPKKPPRTKLQAMRRYPWGLFISHVRNTVHNLYNVGVRVQRKVQV